MEEWQDVPGYEGLYQASNLGRVKRIALYFNSKPDGIIKPNIDKRYGYANVCLSKDNKPYTTRLHKIIMLTFVGPRPHKMHINHKNGDKLDNRLENLEYCTVSENIRHGHEVLGIKYNIPPVHYGENHPQSVLVADQVREIRNLYSTGNYSSRRLAKMFSVSKVTILNIVNNKVWKGIY